MLGKNFINGRWVDSHSAETFESRNPANRDEVLGTIPSSDGADVDEAVRAARNAFPSWRAMSRIKRGEIFDRFVQLVKKDHEDLSRLMARECGKAINESRADVTEGIHMAQYVFGATRMPAGDVLASEIAEKDAYMLRHPKGVVAAITPWNFPFAIPLWLLGPSLVEGNTAVFKPSEDTPLVGQKMVEYLERAGIPPGVLNLVQGDGERAGRPLVSHSDVDVVAFTGSFEVGSEIRKVCADSPHKFAVCEMGGKNAVIVFEDADFPIALNAAVLSAYKTTGQRCVSSGKLIVHEAVYDRFCGEFVKLSKRVAVGDPLDEKTFMGPLINEAGRKKMEFYNDLARKEGGRVLLEGGALKGKECDRGHFVSPFVYQMDYSPKSRVLREEVFAPNVAIVPFRTTDEAIRIYNDTDYGLSLAVITEDYRKARRIREECEYGLGYVNLPSIGAEVHLPFGGVKKSGTGMPSASALIDAVTHKTAWTVNHAKEIKMAQGLKAEIE
ncbi:MAG TPA: aldehyde dehydrogenase family protein [Nitrospiria bacterium]|nr:aldehyde dehydrogenase family protein [Nitrospiria bacterium]